MHNNEINRNKVGFFFEVNSTEVKHISLQTMSRKGCLLEVKGLVNEQNRMSNS